MSNLSGCRHYIWATLQLISKTGSGQMPWAEWSFSSSLVCVKTSRRLGGGGCTSMGLKLDENEQWLVPGGLPALSEIPRHPEGTMWSMRGIQDCAAAARVGHHAIEKVASCHYGGHPKLGRAVSPCSSLRPLQNSLLLSHHLLPREGCTGRHFLS